ncbi:MAG: nitrogen fixation protein NifH [Lachnospiraceae bacterium]|nr:nitrogen fixation protein NifH [Lachnospiraceae bacterium]
MEIAVYGKGGIGKSTVSANLSAALAQAGHHILQIGCDPKHDSTRLLTHGAEVETVLHYLRSVSREEEDPSKVLAEGYLGVGCVEAGGPKPGVGCAGRGIITAFEFLDRHGIKEQYDTVLYDVLGDVVCGGFAVPVRREYSDAIFLVTSGEFMALYAANNILRGIRNFDGTEKHRVAGIIYNERKVADEDGRVRRFAEAVGLPVCVKVPRSNAFAEAEERKMPLMELPGCEAEKAVFLELAGQIDRGAALYEAKPLTDDALEEIVLGNGSRLEEFGAFSENAGVRAGEIAGAFSETDSGRPEITACEGEREEDHPGTPGSRRGSIYENIKEQETQRLPLYGCAFNGACVQAVHLKDAVVIAHGPRACAFYTLQTISSSGRKNLFNRGILMPSSVDPHFESTDIGQAEAVFGGMDLLMERVKKAVERKPGAVIVISSCVSGIIGDDIRQAERLSTPETPVITIAADGDISGDYMHGIEMCMDTLAERIIDPSVQPGERCVNIINEAGVSNNIAYNFEVIRGLLDRMDVHVNCRYLGDAKTEELRGFLRAPLNLLAYTDDASLKRKAWLEERYGCRFLEEAFPVGFEASEVWLRKIGAFFDRSGMAEEIISAEKTVYEQELAELRRVLEGKTILLTTINADLDWLITAAASSGMRFLWIGVLNYLHTPLCVTKHPELCGEISPELDWTMIRDKIEEKKPDLVLSNYTQVMQDGSYIQDSLPMMPAAGFHSALHILRRWADLFGSGKEGEWKNDSELFEQYFS